MTVGSFERYSAQCALRSPEDAELHARLQRSAGQARALLEDALERLALAEGITVVPIRTGLGWRLGVNLGYLKFTPNATWNPF